MFYCHTSAGSCVSAYGLDEFPYMLRVVANGMLEETFKCEIMSSSSDSVGLGCYARSSLVELA